MFAKGSSTIEVLIALFIFQLATVAVLQGQWRARQQVVLAQQELKATALLFDIAATLQQLPQLPITLQTPLSKPLADIDCVATACSLNEQAQALLQPILKAVLIKGGFDDAQLCIQGNYPFIQLHFSWRSYWLMQRDVGTGDCLRHGTFHQVQIQVEARR